MKKIIAASIVISLLIVGGVVFYLNNMNNANTVGAPKPAPAKPKGNEIASMAEFGSYPMYVLEDLTKGAELIVKGTVKSVSEPRWNNKENRKPDPIRGEDTIYKDTVFEVDKECKGTASSNTVKVRSSGGRTDDFELINDMELKLNVGDEAIMFLVHDDSIYNKEKDTEHYVLLGALQAVYSISGSDASNVHESMTVAELEQKIEDYLRNPKQTQQTGGPSVE
jgi:hypothetical protein